MPTRHTLSKRPLYRQVRDLLARRIAEGEWKPGVSLPSEEQLARELEISLGTVRKALDNLEDERLVVRRQGRGTTVLDQASEELANRFYNIADAKEQPLRGDVEVLQQTTGAAGEVELERLQLDASETVLRTERLRHAAGRPFIHEKASLALSRLPGLCASDVGNYRLLALAQRCGVHLGWARERVMLVEATPEIAGLLAIEADLPLLRLDRVVFAGDGRPVEWRVGLCHLPDDTAYSIRMK